MASSNFGKRRRGITLVELMIAMGMMTLMGGVLFSVAFTGMRMARNTDTAVGAFSDSRAAFEMINADIGTSDAVLAQYPPTGTAAFTSNNTTTLILRRPRVDTNNVILPGQFDVIIYQIRGRTAPFTLRRLTAQITAGVGTTATQERILSRTIEGATIRYIAVDSFTGNGSNRNFTLRGTPIASSPEQANQIIVGGRDRVADGNCNFDSVAIACQFAPRSGTMVDAIYNVNPNVSINPDGHSAARVVQINLRARAQSRNSRSQLRNRTMEFNSRSELRSP